ncbi:TPA: hypothetical protein ACOTFJ_000005 [Clostridium perfringens]
MENRNEDNLIDEFNELVSEISKSVFDKSIYRDLKLTEENLIKTLTSTSEKTATINRNNLISLQNNLKVILDEAIADFNLGVQQGEEAFEKKANEFLNNIEEVSTKSKENIYHLKDKARETYDEIERLKEHIEKIEEMDKMLKGECLRVMNCVNKLENRLKVDKSEIRDNFLGFKEYMGEGLEEINYNVKLEFNEIKDLLEEGNTNMNNSMELLNSAIDKYNVDVIDATRRLGERVNNLDRKISSMNKGPEEPFFHEELKSELDKKYYFLVIGIVIVGILAVLF